MGRKWNARDLQAQGACACDFLVFVWPPIEKAKKKGSRYADTSLFQCLFPIRSIHKARGHLRGLLNDYFTTLDFFSKMINKGGMMGTKNVQKTVHMVYG